MRKQLSIMLCSIMMATTVITPSVSATAQTSSYVSHEILLAETKEELTEATEALNKANEALESAKETLKTKETELREINPPVLEAEKRLKEVIDVVDGELNEKKNTLNQIEKAHASAKTAMEKEKAAYDEAVTLVNNAKSNLEKAETALDSARTAAGVEKGEEGKTRTSLDFFQSIGDMEAVSRFKNSNYVSYSNVGDGEDATSLTNMKSAIEWMVRVNTLRKSIGLSELNVTSQLMATAQSNANYSDQNLSHSNQFGVSENLAWNWNNNPSVDYKKTGSLWQWYTEEKRIFDLAVDNIKNNVVTYKGTYDNSSTSFRATDEQIALLKKIRANNKITQGDKVSLLYSLDFYHEVGHYLTLIKDGLTLQGFAVCSRGSNYPYTYTYSNTFASSSWYQVYTVTEYSELFHTYLDQCNALTKTKEAYDMAKSNYDKSKQTNLTALYQSYTEAKDTYEAYTTSYHTIKTAYDTALSESHYVHSLSYKSSATITNEKYAYLNDIFAKAYAVNDKVEALETEISSIKTNVSNQTTAVKAAQSRVKTAQSAYDAAGNHKWDAYTTIKEPTFSEEGEKVRTCLICGNVQHTKIAKKKGKIRFTYIPGNRLVMRRKQSTSGLKISELADGDHVISIQSSNKKIVTVSKVKNTGCTLKAGNKNGTATITITLKSGLTKKFKVYVQRGTVRTAKLTGLPKSVSVKKGKSSKLKPVKVPFTSQQRVTYKSSNKKIATVTSSGKIIGKKKGSTYITVRSGSKSYRVKVTVK